MSGIGKLTTPTVVQAGEKIADTSALRGRIVVQNNDPANNVVIKPDANPGSDTDGIVLTPGQLQSWEIRNEIWAKSNNIAGTLISVLDITY